MSPISFYNNRSKVNAYPQPKLVLTNQFHFVNPKFEYENLHTLTKGKTLPFNGQAQSADRYMRTNNSIPETIIHCSVNNQAYGAAMLQKSSTTQNISNCRPLNPRISRTPISTSNREINVMDFRPLITQGRRRFGTVQPSSSLIITKKKSPSPMRYSSCAQKPLTRSIPVDIVSNNMAIVVSSMIPSSLSYSSSYSSSSSASTSASSTNAGAVFLPIQVTKSQNNNQNNNNNNNNSSGSNRINCSHINSTHEGQRFHHRYVQNPPGRRQTVLLPKLTASARLDDGFGESRRISSSSSTGGEGSHFRSTFVMDSHVLRLIRRYDPGSSSTTGVVPRTLLDDTRSVWHTVAPNTDTFQPFESSPFLANRSLTTTYEDELALNKAIPRLQRQQAIRDVEPSPPPSSAANKSLRPILKYGSSRSRSEFFADPRVNESAKLESGLPGNESAATYQPSMTPGSRRVCAALSKSEWDLRLQQEPPPPMRPPSPPLMSPPQEKESYRPVLGRSKSSMGIDTLRDDEEPNEPSQPAVDDGSYVERLKQLFVTKSSLDITTNPALSNQHRTDSVDSNLSRRVHSSTHRSEQSPAPVKTTPVVSSVESDARPIIKPTIVVQEVTPPFVPFKKAPGLREQKTFDSLELVNRPNNSHAMSPSELSYDTYRLHRLNDPDSTGTRAKNIAKVEPYSINTNAVRSLYPSSLQPITMTTASTSAVPAKTRINLNSMENTPTNSSALSSIAASHNIKIRPSAACHSDFLVPHPACPTPSSPLLSTSSSYTTPPVLLSESLSHGSLQQLPTFNASPYNGRSTGLTSSRNNSPSIPADFHSSMHTLNNYNFSSPTSYHYRPPSSSVTTASTTIINNSRQRVDLAVRATTIEQPHQDDSITSGQQHQSRRRFQRRKQMKRSKSVDSCQEPSSFTSPISAHDVNRSSQQQQQQQRSTSREHLARAEDLSSSTSSSSSSLTADIERVNRAALLRYKSLDSMTFHNQNKSFHGKSTNDHRRAISKPREYDFDSDDSVCGIPKPRKAIGR